jgi:hypothetical protein
MAKSHNNNATSIFSKIKLTEGMLVTFGLIGMVAAFGIFLVFVSGGAVRHVPIAWKEKVEATLSFRNVDGELKIIGIRGTTQVNPTLLSRTGDTAYILNVINQDTMPHIFYIDGLNMHTKIIRPSENDTITIYSKRDGTYNYYDWPSNGKPLGQFKAVKVAGDEWS